MAIVRYIPSYIKTIEREPTAEFFRTRKIKTPDTYLYLSKAQSPSELFIRRRCWVHLRAYLFTR